MASVGERIKALRTRLGISQVDFAKRIGVSKQTLYKYENNIITNIPSDKIEAIARIFGISPAMLMGWEEGGSDGVEDSEQRPGYYLNEETAQIAQQIFDDHDLRALFDAARGSTPQDLQMAAAFLKRLKETNPDG